MGEIVNAFGIDLRLLIIQVVNFGLLLSVLWLFLYRPVMDMLEKRKQTIEKGVADAEKAEQKLTQIEGEKEHIMTQATQEAGKIVEHAKERGSEVEKEMLSEAEGKRDQILKEAEMKAEEAKRQALTESKEEIVRLSILGAEKVLKEQR